MIIKNDFVCRSIDFFLTGDEVLAYREEKRPGLVNDIPVYWRMVLNPVIAKVYLIMSFWYYILLICGAV